MEKPINTNENNAKVSLVQNGEDKEIVVNGETNVVLTLIGECIAGIITERKAKVNDALSVIVGTVADLLKAKQENEEPVESDEVEAQNEAKENDGNVYPQFLKLERYNAVSYSFSGNGSLLDNFALIGNYLSAIVLQERPYEDAKYSIPLLAPVLEALSTLINTDSDYATEVLESFIDEVNNLAASYENLLVKAEDNPENNNESDGEPVLDGEPVPEDPKGE